MAAILIAFLVFACTLGGALLGAYLHRRVPQHHLERDSRAFVQAIMGLIATMVALVLGLLVASAKDAYDTQLKEMQQLAANIVRLNSILTHYGPEADEARAALRDAAAAAAERIWPSRQDAPPDLQPFVHQAHTERFYSLIQNLAPGTEAQKFIQTRGLEISADLAETRMLMYAQSKAPISWPFFLVLLFWLTPLFIGFGLFVRFNATVVIAMVLGAMSIASATYLIMDLNHPYAGIIRISDDAMKAALVQLRQ
jgi:hypothetical protein